MVDENELRALASELEVAVAKADPGSARHLIEDFAVPTRQEHPRLAGVEPDDNPLAVELAYDRIFRGLFFFLAWFIGARGEHDHCDQRQEEAHAPQPSSHRREPCVRPPVCGLNTNMHKSYFSATNAAMAARSASSVITG